MSGKSYNFVPLDLRNATDKEYECTCEFANILRHEQLPDDPPITLEEHTNEWKSSPPVFEFETRIAWDKTGSKLIAQSLIYFANTGDNEHLAQFQIEVLPDHRRQGYARKALDAILQFAKKHNRTLLMTSSSDRVPASAAFMNKIGARKGMEAQTNQLRISEFDKSLVQTWLDKSSHMKDSFDLGLLDGPYPEEKIKDISDLYQVVANDQPRDTLEMEDRNYSVEYVRGIEQMIFGKGDQRWVYYIIDRASGKVAGLTEVMWSPNRPTILNQGFTGVYPDFRSKGIGRWLKSEMMNKILTERPEVEFIRTGNANSNAPMLKINVEMGFKPYKSETMWQVETEKIENYLVEKQQ